MTSSTLWGTQLSTLGLSCALAVAVTSVSTNVGANDSTLKFSPVPVPTTDAEKRQVSASDTVSVDGTDYPIGYNTLLRSGDPLGENMFGLQLDVDGNPVYAEDGSPTIMNSNDFSSLIPVGNKLFMISHFESRPGAMYLSELNQDAATGKLKALSTRNIDFSSLHGMWVPCAGSVTPWGTHLGSEEYEPDAKNHDPATGEIDDYYNAMGAYYGGDLLKINPYFYGYPVEVGVMNEQGDTKVDAHYAMGRVAVELAYVMPDQKTAYISDDGTNVGLYMFIADKAGDLSAGTLYAMKWNQTSADNGGSANLDWVALGHATDAEIKAVIDDYNGAGKPPKFEDIFTSVEPDPDDASCPADYVSVNHGHDTGIHECLQLKPGMALAASRLETRRYAAYLGATTELRKEEGITFDPSTQTLYVAMSEVSSGMEDKKKDGEEDDGYDIGGPNHIRLPYNLCGTVYGLQVGGNRNDKSGQPIASQYVAKNMYGVVQGRMTQASDPNSSIPAYDPNGPYANNTCDLEGISNPDNLTFIRGYKTLIIGEDTGDGHQNDAIWSYNLETKKLTRILTSSYGSETTSPYFYPNINGWGYLMGVIQHPYGESDDDKVPPGSAERRAYTGYIGPFPKMSD